MKSPREDSLVSVTKKEASHKDWDMDFSVRLEGKSMLTSKIDLTDQACFVADVQRLNCVQRILPVRGRRL
jgi:hypothetical protein